jgi:hypothetical protein
MDLLVFASTSTYSNFQQPINQVRPLTQVVLAAKGQNQALSPQQVLTPGGSALIKD